jgi:signal transduction histidine kinase
MNRKTLIKLLALSLSVSLFISTVLLYSFRELEESRGSVTRKPGLLLLAQIAESEPAYFALRQFDRIASAPGIRHPRKIWVVGEGGVVLGSSPPSTPLPIAWKDLEIPKVIHEFTAHFGPFDVTPDFFLIRLNAQLPLYLLLQIPTRMIFFHEFLPRAIFLLACMSLSAFLGLLITFVYLRRKSQKAKEVLGRLEKGELKARFPITKLDEIGSLMTDFNRMADEIEHLITRIEETERARQELLQELGHDLRTPLTGLRTASDTLASHSREMSHEERERFIHIIQTESLYFLRMIENLFLIAEVAEPRYRKTAETIDLGDLVESEIDQQKNQDSPVLSWAFSPPSTRQFVVGDPVLLKRLFRNALENARRFAQSRVSITFDEQKSPDTNPMAKIRIQDDGPGIPPEEIQIFGKRRSRRFSADDKVSDPTVSMGLGSVIMAAIVRVHGGTLSVRNLNHSGPERHGTEVLIQLPASIR